jgi:hypothetical protein
LEGAQDARISEVTSDKRFTRPQFLLSLREISLEPGARLEARDIRRAVVSQALSPPVDGGDLRAEYKSVLHGLGIQRLHVPAKRSARGSETTFSVDPEHIQAGMSIVVPQFEQTIEDLCFSGTPPGGATRLMKSMREALEKMGLWKTFCLVIITDSLGRVEQEWKLSCQALVGNNAPIQVLFQRAVDTGIPFPVLIVVYKDTSLSLHECLVHEAMHIFNYYLWRVDAAPPSPAYPLAHALADEAFAIMQGSQILGPRHLFLSEQLELFESAPALTPNAPAFRPLPAYLGDEVVFVDTFPWIVAAASLPEGSVSKTYVERQQSKWTKPWQEKMARQLQPVFMELFATGDLHAQSPRIVATLGTGGPDGHGLTQFSQFVNALIF